MKQLLILLAAAGLCGCGVSGAVDATKSMPDKMDQTIDGMNKTNAKMDQMNDGMKETNDAVRQQGMLLSLQEMLKPENTLYLNPPIRMLPYALKFASFAHSEDLLQLTQAWMIEIKNVGDGEDLTAEQKAQLDHEKMAKLQGLMAIAAFTPQDKVEQMERDQILSGGLYEKEAYAFFMLREVFIKSFLLDAQLLADPISNLGLLSEAVKDAKELTYIISRPYRAKIEVKITGFSNKDLDSEVKIDEDVISDVRGVWQHLLKSGMNEMDAKYRDLTSPDFAEYRQLMDEIRSQLQATKQIQL